MFDEKSSWFAVYTRPRHEKKLAGLLDQKGIEAYVPVRRVLKRWSDRKKWVDEPLISSYCFVRAAPEFYYEVLNTSGAVRYVWFNDRPARIPDSQISVLRLIAGAELETEALPDTFEPGTPVRVTAGPLIGSTGELVMYHGKRKMIIRIEQLKTVLTVTISPLWVERRKNEE